MRQTSHGATMSPRMERLWAFIQDERGIHLHDFSTDRDVEGQQGVLAAGEKALLARLSKSPDDRDLQHLLADYRSVMNRRPRERVDAGTIRAEAKTRGEVGAEDEIAEMVGGKAGRSW